MGSTQGTKYEEWPWFCGITVAFAVTMTWINCKTWSLVWCSKKINIINDIMSLLTHSQRWRPLSWMCQHNFLLFTLMVHYCPSQWTWKTFHKRQFSRISVIVFQLTYFGYCILKKHQTNLTFLRFPQVSDWGFTMGYFFIFWSVQAK